MWQEGNHTGELAPLGLAGGQVLVDDGLCAIGEVAELRLPCDHSVLVAKGVAVLEAHTCIFGQCRVEHLEASAVVLFFRVCVEWVVRSAVIRVVEHRVALRERTAL